MNPRRRRHQRIRRMLRKHPERAAEVLRRPAPTPFVPRSHTPAPALALAPRRAVDSVGRPGDEIKPRSRGVPPVEVALPKRKNVVQVSPDAKKAVGGSARRKALKSLTGPR